jgi:hypothetical protein
MGFGYLETQQKIQVHYLMWLGTAVVFAAGVIAFNWDFVSAGLPRAIVKGPTVEGGPRHRRRVSIGT